MKQSKEKKKKGDRIKGKKIDEKEMKKEKKRQNAQVDSITSQLLKVFCSYC